MDRTGWPNLADIEKIRDVPVSRPWRKLRKKKRCLHDRLPGRSFLKVQSGERRN